MQMSQSNQALDALNRLIDVEPTCAAALLLKSRVMLNNFGQSEQPLPAEIALVQTNLTEVTKQLAINSPTLKKLGEAMMSEGLKPTRIKNNSASANIS